MPTIKGFSVNKPIRNLALSCKKETVNRKRLIYFRHKSKAKS